MFHIAVTIGFNETGESVEENAGNVTIHVIIISGTLERELCVEIIPESGSASGMALVAVNLRGAEIVMVLADAVRPRILNVQNIFPQLGARHNSYCPLYS